LDMVRSLPACHWKLVGCCEMSQQNVTNFV
jgi:hypothetical protein